MIRKVTYMTLAPLAGLLLIASVVGAQSRMEALITGLRDPDPSVRKEIADVLGDLKDPAAVPTESGVPGRTAASGATGTPRIPARIVA